MVQTISLGMMLSPCRGFRGRDQRQTQINPASNTQRVSGDLNISQFSVVRRLPNLLNCVLCYQNITKLLTRPNISLSWNFHLFLVSVQRGWFGCVLWHINHCRLFNAKSSLYIYSKYIWFGFVGFYGISTIVGYLMPNPVYTYILNIYDLVWLGFMAYRPL